jgi:hypothetical protein
MLAAVAVTAFAAAVITGNGQSDDGHPVWHLLQGVLTVPIALVILLVRRAWPAGVSTGRLLARAYLATLGVAAGNVLAAVGAPIPYASDWTALIHPHTIGEVLAFGSLAILLLVCLVMLGVGVRGAMRPATAQPI